MSVHKSVTLSIGLDKDSPDTLTGPIPLVRAYIYPGSDWFGLAIGRSRDDILVTLAEWERIKQNIDTLIEESKSCH